MVISAMLGFRAILDRLRWRSSPKRTITALAVALALLLANSLWWNRELHFLSIGKGELKYQLVCDWMVNNLDANAACLAVQASGALFYYTNFSIIRWDSLNADNVAQIERAVRRSGKPLYAVLFPYEIEERHVLEKRMPGHWIEVGNVDDVTVWRREFDTERLVLEAPSTKTGFNVEGSVELRRNQESFNGVEATYRTPNWWALETKGKNYWRWSKGDGSVGIHNPQPFALAADVSFGLATIDSRSVAATVNGKVVWNGVLKPGEDNQATIAGIELPPGDTMVSFRSDRPAVYSRGSDRREFAFSIQDLKITLKGKR
jgi:hypothetical protein